MELFCLHNTSKTVTPLGNLANIMKLISRKMCTYPTVVFKSSSSGYIPSRWGRSAFCAVCKDCSCHQPVSPWTGGADLGEVQGSDIVIRFHPKKTVFHTLSACPLPEIKTRRERSENCRFYKVCFWNFILFCLQHIPVFPHSPFVPLLASVQ